MAYYVAFAKFETSNEFDWEAMRFIEDASR